MEAVLPGPEARGIRVHHEWAEARIFGWAEVYDKVRIFHEVKVSGKINISGNASISGEAWIHDRNTFIRLGSVVRSMVRLKSLAGLESLGEKYLHQPNHKSDVWLKTKERAE